MSVRKKKSSAYGETAAVREASRRGRHHHRHAHTPAGRARGRAADTYADSIRVVPTAVTRRRTVTRVGAGECRVPRQRTDRAMTHVAHAHGVTFTDQPGSSVMTITMDHRISSGIAHIMPAFQHIVPCAHCVRLCIRQGNTSSLYHRAHHASQPRAHCSFVYPARERKFSVRMLFMCIRQGNANSRPYVVVFSPHQHHSSA